MPACWRTGMDGNLCRYGNLVDGFLRFDSVICRIQRAKIQTDIGFIEKCLRCAKDRTDC